MLSASGLRIGATNLKTTWSFTFSPACAFKPISLTTPAAPRWKSNGCNPVYFFRSLHIAWNGLLKFIARPINFITDLETYRIIQPSIRNSICYESVRYALSNLKLMGALYDTIKPTSYIEKAARASRQVNKRSPLL